MRLPCLLFILGAPIVAEDDLHLATHGFVSFGHLKSWGNNWLGPTREGSNEFWETAVNTTARPMDRLRLGAQLFARDLGNYDNGKVQLDLLYADWRAADEIGIQVGRIKFPLGLLSESLDENSTRASVFVAPNVYSPRSRDLLISTDGAKIYGSIDQLDYTVFGGRKRFDPEGSFTQVVRETNPFSTVDQITQGWTAGAMVHWHLPVEGLALRLTISDTHDLDVTGEIPGAGITTDTHADDYLLGIISILYETGSFTWMGEYARTNSVYVTTLSPAVIPEFTNLENTDQAYVSGTWHWRPWLEFYGAVEEGANIVDRTRGSVLTTVLAVNVQPLNNWSVKAEFRDNHGDRGAFAVDNPDGVEKRWQVLAVKTTVDF